MAVSGKKEVYGGFASVNLRKPDLKQEDPKKGDYVKGKDAFAKVGDIPTKPEDIGAQPVGNYLQRVPDGYATEEWVQEGFQPKGEYLTKIPDGYAKTEDIPTKPEDIGAQPAGNYLTEVPSGYATEEFVRNKIAEAELGGEEVDLSGYAQKSELPTKVSQLQNDSGYLTEHQDISGKLDASALPTAINTALAQAKASGEFDGKDGKDGVDGQDGYTPQKGVDYFDGNPGRDGVDGKDGSDGYTPVKGKDYFDGKDGSPGADGSDGITPHVGSNGNWFIGENDTGIPATGPAGGQGLPGTPGEDGKDGKDGKDGTSVTVSKVTESTADGGSNVVEFSDGKTLTVKNGKTGAAGKDGSDGLPGTNGAPGQDGYTPVRGVDYYTEADKSEFSEYIATELAKRGQLKPEFANSIEECTDTTKMYVLPDGMIYAYMLTEVEVESGGGDYTNILPLAVNTDGTPYVGNNGEKGYKTGWRLNSSLLEKEQSGMCCTGYLPITPGTTGTLRFKNITVSGTSGGYIYAFKSDFSSGIGANSLFESTLSNSYDAKTGVYTITLGSTAGTNGVTVPGFSGLQQTHYLRVSIGNINENTIITWNEEITEKTTEIVKEYIWASTGHAFVPADYEERIIAVENTAAANKKKIAELEKTVENGADGDVTEKDALSRIKLWDKPVYDPAPVTLLGDDRVKPALTDSDRTINAIYAKYRALMAKYPDYITETNLGKSTSSAVFTAVDVLRFDFKEPDGRHEAGYALNETKPKLIFMTGVHREWAGIYGLYYALEEIAENPAFDDIRRNAHIIVVPCINPHCLGYTATIDGWVMSHVNGNGVAIHNNFNVDHNTYNANAQVGDLNYGGTAPCSEPETQYMDKVMADNPDAVAFVSCHNYNYDTIYGTSVIWASSATAHMCNIAFRMIDKLSKAWLDKYGNTLIEAINTYKTNKLADGDYRLGFAQFSTSAGTEQLNATRYGIQATNLEISDQMWVFSGKTAFTSETMTHGAEVYANFMRTLLWSYDHKDKKEYAPNLPWSE